MDPPKRRATYGRRAMGLAELLTLSDHTDETGRLLLEDSASPGAIRAVVAGGVLMETTECPYEETPSRLGGQMNVAALNALRSDFQEVINGFAWLAGSRLAMHDFDRRNSVNALMATSELAITIPLVLFNRARDPVDSHGKLPSFVASIFKAGRGLFSMSVDLLNRSENAARRVSTPDVVHFAEAGGHLRRANTERVCAAPMGMIERTLDAILTGDGADPSRSMLATLIDFPELWRFYELQENFSQALNLYRFQLGEATSAGGMRPSPDLFSSLVGTASGPQPFGEVTEGFLRNINRIQEELNSVLGREGRPPKLRFQDALNLF